jgi:glycyl-tRNA synthetase
MEKKISLDEISTFAKARGFIFRSSDIYGGFAGFWDYGPLGSELFNNLKSNWWNFFVQQKGNMVGIDASVISHPRTWKASGHIDNFSDIAVICKRCKKATKIDKSEEGKVKCECGGDYESQGEFKLLFQTQVGALDSSAAYLRGETAQGMFMDFKLVSDSARKQLPFGIAQVGKCFRNEIAPRNFIFRSREFTIGEFEFFIHPEEKKCNLLEKRHLDLKLKLLDAESQEKENFELKETTIGKMLKEKRMDEWHAYWLAEQILWFYSLGLEKIKIREHMKDELSHYSSATFDIDYEYPFGSQEVAGNANRGQYDLTQHINESKQKLEIFDEASKKNVVPRVIEPTFGMDRVFLAILVNGYHYDKERENIVLKIPARIAPIKAAVFPLVKKDEGLVKFSKEIVDSLKSEWNVLYDESGSVGKRYARQDEIGTPYCFTVDGQSLEDETLTIRDRDSGKQKRIKKSEVRTVFRELIFGEKSFEDL